MNRLRLLSLIGTVLIILYILYRLTLVWMVNAKRDELRQQGYIVDKNAFLASLPQIPDEENAAVGILKVFPKFDTTSADAKDVMELNCRKIEIKPRKNGNRFRLDTTNINQNIPLDLLSKMDIYVQKHEPFMQDIFQSLSREKSFYPCDYKTDLLLNVKVKCIFDARKLATILRAFSIYYAERGNQNKASEYLMASLEMSETLKNEPFLISHLVQIASCNISYMSLERSISRIQFTENQLLKIQTQLQKTNLLNFKNAYAIKLLSSLEILDSSDVSKEFRFKEFISQFSDPNNLMNLKLYKYTLQSFYYQYFYATADIQSIEKLYLMDIYEKSIKAEKLKSSDRLKEYEKIMRRIQKTPSLFFTSKHGLPFNCDFFKNQINAHVKNQTAIAAVAIERYRLKYGCLPDSLEQLAPEFVDNIPLDPFTEKPLLYKKNEKGYVVYSVGKDLTDNGGKRTNSSGQEIEDGSDVVFEVVR